MGQNSSASASQQSGTTGRRDDGGSSEEWSCLGRSLDAGMREISRPSFSAWLQRFEDSNDGNSLELQVAHVHDPPCVAVVPGTSLAFRDAASVPLCGDLLVGFAAVGGDVPAFELEVCGVRNASLAVPAMRRGELRVALGGRYPIPLTSMHSRDVLVVPGLPLDSLGVPPGCWPVFANLPPNLRAELRGGVAVARFSPRSAWAFAGADCVEEASTGCTGCIPCTGCIVGSRRRCVRCLVGISGTGTGGGRCVRLPALLGVDPPLGAMMARAKERTDALREELARAAWHPRRVRGWCLAHDDFFFGGAGGASPPADPE